jgi:ribosome modulation factor
MFKSQDIDHIAQEAYEAGYEGRDSEELPTRLSDQLETGFEYVWLDNYRKGQNDARDNESFIAAQDWEDYMVYGHPDWD